MLEIKNNNVIKVSVVMLAYNHEEFISQAINSILSQRVSFPYEIIIGEDYSTDNTRDIIKKYQNKYPDIIKPIFRNQNIGSTTNFYEAIMNCKGEYIACLEGDDFWTDENKLQKQVDFLCTHQDYIAVAHRNIIVDKHGNKIDESSDKMPLNQMIGKKSLMKYTTNLAHPSAMLYRNIFKDSKDSYSIIAESNKYGTHFMMLTLLMNKGSLYIFDDCMSAWRCVVSEEASNYTSMANKKPLEAADNYFIMIKNLKTYFQEDYNFEMLNAKHYASSMLKVIRFWKQDGNKYLKKFSSYMNFREMILSIYFLLIKSVKIILSKIKFNK